MPSELSSTSEADAASDCGEVQERLVKIIVNDYIVEALCVADIFCGGSQTLLDYLGAILSAAG